MIIVSMQGYAVKRVPKMIRGIIMSLIAVFAAIGTILYLQVQKVFFHTYPNMVFGTLALFDALALALILVSIAFDWYGNDAAKQAGDGASDAPDKATAMEDAGFVDEFPEVPFAKDLYDEAVPEVSEYREFSHRGETLYEGTMKRSNRDFYDTRHSRRDSEKRSRML